MKQIKFHGRYEMHFTSNTMYIGMNNVVIPSIIKYNICYNDITGHMVIEKSYLRELKRDGINPHYIPYSICSENICTKIVCNNCRTVKIENAYNCKENCIHREYIGKHLMFICDNYEAYKKSYRDYLYNRYYDRTYSMEWEL